MKKFSKKIIYHGIIRSILIGLFVYFYAFIMILSEAEGDNIELIIFVISIVPAIIAIILYNIYMICYYKLSGYEFKETQVVCKRGVIFKKVSTLDYSKINSINKKQGIIQKIFKISTLMLDSGSTTRAHQAEILVYEEEKIINELYDKLKSLDKAKPQLEITNTEKQEEKLENNKPENLYVFTAKSKIIYSLINSLVCAILAIIIVALITVALYLVYKFDNDGLQLIDLIIIPLAFYVTICLGGALSSVVRSFIGFFDFKITKVNNNINVEYGLFVNTQNSFDLSKVKGVIIHQGLIQRIFKLCTIKVEVIGYIEISKDQNAKVIGMLIPLCKLSDVSMYLEKIIPSHIPTVQEYKSKAFMPYISWNTIIPFAIALLCYIPALSICLSFDSMLALIICSAIIGGIFIIYEIILLIISIFAYYAQDITFDENNITVYSGALTKHSTVISKKNIIAIEDITTSFRAKKGIYSYTIHFYTNAMSNTKRVHNIDEKYKELLLNCLKY